MLNGYNCRLFLIFTIYLQNLKTWQNECERLKSGDTSEYDPHQISAHEYRLFKIINIEKITDDIFVYDFATDILNESFLLRVGQHLILKQNDGEKVVTRQYTPISELDQKRKFTIILKLYETGVMSNLIKNWNIGDEISWCGPFGSFSYALNSFEKILLLGCGTGVAPLYQVIRFILNEDSEETHVQLLYASKNIKSILLRYDLLEFMSYWNFDMIHYINDKGAELEAKYNEKIIGEKISKSVVTKVINDSYNSAKTLVLICGTNSFVKDMINCVQSHSSKNLHMHTF